MILVAVFQSNLLFESSVGAVKMEVVCFFRKVSIPYYFLTVWKETIPFPFELKCGNEMEKRQDLLLNSKFEGLISHITFYRNMISFCI